MSKFNIFCMTAMLLTSLTHTKNKLIVLVSTPRCMSTAFLRMMKNRDDFTVMNEPGMQIYQRMVFGDNLQEGIGLGNKTLDSFQQLRETILQELLHRNVFIKEIACAAALYLMQDNELIHNYDCYVLFLIRNPHASFISLYKKLYALIPDSEALRQFDMLTWPIISYEPVLSLYQSISSCARNKPLVFCAEDIVKQPELMMQHFCEHVGILFDAKSLTWESHTAEFSPHEVLGDTKSHYASFHWHQEALASTGFHGLSHYALDEHGTPTFEEITDLKTRTQYKGWYDACLPSYNELLQRAVLTS